MKIKDLAPGTNLGGIKVRTPDGVEGYWVSQWQKGVFLGNNPEGGGEMTPVFIESLPEVLEWDIIEPENQSHV